MRQTLGALYESAIEVGPPSDDRLVTAAAALWRHNNLDGPYADRRREPWDQARVSAASILSNDWVVGLYGVAKLPDGSEALAGNVHVREGGARGSDWLVLYIPMPVLAGIYGSDTVEDISWLGWARLDDWFADIGWAVYNAVPFALGVVGEEVSWQHQREGRGSRRRTGERPALDPAAERTRNARLVSPFEPAVTRALKRARRRSRPTRDTALDRMCGDLRRTNRRGRRTCRPRTPGRPATIAGREPSTFGLVRDSYIVSGRPVGVFPQGG